MTVDPLLTLFIKLPDYHGARFLGWMSFQPRSVAELSNEFIQFISLRYDRSNKSGSGPTPGTLPLSGELKFVNHPKQPAL
jgi:hypothetical protein